MDVRTYWIENMDVRTYWIENMDVRTYWIENMDVRTYWIERYKDGQKDVRMDRKIYDGQKDI